MPELHDPPPAPWPALARHAVLELCRGEHRRRHPPLLHVGLPGEAHVVVPAEDGEAPLDHALRVDVLAAALHRADRAGDRVDSPAPLVWVTRTGDLEVQDVDVGWLAAGAAACAEAGRDLTMVVVTRRGWRDPRTGAGATWKRLRVR